jgi:hypothetical protein
MHRSGEPPVTLEGVAAAALECRVALMRLAAVVEQSLAASAASPSTASSAPRSPGGPATTSSGSSTSSTRGRNIDGEYLELARSCAAAARVSQLEAQALHDAVKYATAMRAAAERERDRLEDRIDEQRETIAALQQAAFASAANAMMMTTTTAPHGAPNGATDATLAHADGTSSPATTSPAVATRSLSSSLALASAPLSDRTLPGAAPTGMAPAVASTMAAECSAAWDPLTGECRSCVDLRAQLAALGARSSARIAELEEELARAMAELRDARR